MGVYVLLTKVGREPHAPAEETQEVQRVKAAVQQLCPEVTWVSTEEFPEPYDYIDILEAPDDLTVSCVATVVRSLRAAAAVNWSAFPHQQGGCVHHVRAHS
jgi:uncharacterized protein with GYD domain